MPRKILIVTGLPRGGTSMAAAVAHELGIPMHLPGEDTSPKVAQDRYPYGTLEDRTFREVVWSAIDSGGDQESFHLRRKWKECFTASEGAALSAWLGTRLKAAEGDWVGVKLPAACYCIKPLVEFFGALNIAPSVVVVRRDFDEAVRSLADKRGLEYAPDCPSSWARCVQAINAYHLELCDAYLRRENVPAFRITFQGMLTYPRAAVNELSRFCGVSVNPEAVKAIDKTLHDRINVRIAA